jgi:hypothetical protein
LFAGFLIDEGLHAVWSRGVANLAALGLLAILESAAAFHHVGQPRAPVSIAVHLSAAGEGFALVLEWLGASSGGFEANVLARNSLAQRCILYVTIEVFLSRTPVRRPHGWLNAADEVVAFEFELLLATLCRLPTECLAFRRRAILPV